MGILYYLTDNKGYVILATDIIWTIVQGVSQQEEINPDMENEGQNGYLSLETLGDGCHFSTLSYDIYDYLHIEYFK